jgi:predicted Zn-dependent protease
MRALGRWGASALGLGALIFAASCNEIGTPLHVGFYGYSIPVSDVVAADTIVDDVAYFAGDTITDTVNFSWPASAMPVRIWVQDTVDLPAHMHAAVAAWKNVLQYGELAAAFVSDSTTADVIVRGSAPPPAPVAAGVRRLWAASNAPAACEGGTDIFVSAPDHTKLWTPIRVYVIPKFALDNVETPPCLARVSIHELGHALGLFRHSPNADDLMYSFPSVDAPSEGDATTILTLYHQHSDLRPVPATDTLPATSSRP